MADTREIQGWRNAYKDYSRAELIHVMHSKAEHCAEHIAARQVLDALGQSSQKALFGLGSQTLRWTIVAAIAAIVGAIAAIIAVFRT